jgi:hypothetical protein
MHWRRLLSVLFGILLLCPLGSQAQQGGTVLPGKLDVNTSGDHELVAAVTGQKIRVYDWFLVCNGVVNLILKDSTPTTLLPVVNCASAPCSWVEDFHIEAPRYTTGIGKALILNLDANTQCSGHFAYTQGR